METKEINVPIENTYIHVTSFGNGSRNLIILPGVSLIGFENIGPAIATSYKKYYQDFTYHMIGRRKVLPDIYSIEEMAEDVYSVMNNLGIKKADFLGTSMGGMIAQNIGIAHIDAVNALVLGSTTSRLSESSKKYFEDWIEVLEKNDIVGFNRLFVNHIYSEAFIKENRLAFDYLETQGDAADCKRFVSMCKAIINFDVYDQLSRITCPTFVINAKKDVLFPAMKDGKELAERIAGSKFYMYEGDYGHAVYNEAPDYIQRFKDFLLNIRH